MDEIPVQKRDHFFIRALLGRKDCRRALRAVHRVVDVAHGSDGAAGKKALSFCRIVGHDLFERVSGRHKAFALLVIELRSERCGSAGAGVVGAAAAETDDDVFAALLHGIANQAADAEGRRLRGVFVLADHRKSSRLRHFNERGAVLNAVGGRDVFLPRTADAALDFSAPSAQTKQSTVPSPPSATGMVSTSQPGIWRLTVFSAIWQNSSADMVPLNESGMIIHFFILFSSFQKRTAVCSENGCNCVSLFYMRPW